MNVTLNIGNDAELRAHIKEQIKGQVLSIVREEFLEMMKHELERKFKGTNSANFDRMTRDALKMACTDILKREYNIRSWNDSFIKPTVEAEVKCAIKNKNWDKMVDDLAKEKVRSLIG